MNATKKNKKKKKMIMIMNMNLLSLLPHLVSGRFDLNKWPPLSCPPSVTCSPSTLVGLRHHIRRPFPCFCHLHPTRAMSFFLVTDHGMSVP